jgi:diguanylate cyclase (GGDEF)-like protein
MIDTHSTEADRIGDTADEVGVPTGRRAVVRPAVPWALAAVTFVGVMLSIGNGSAWRWTAAAVGLTGAAAARFNRLPLAFSAVLALAAGQLATSGVIDGLSANGDRAELVVNLAVGVALCLMVLLGVQRRDGHLSSRDLVDLSAVVIGTTLVAWISVAQPLLDSADAATAVLVSGYLPLTSVVLMVTIDVAFAGLLGNRTMRLAAAAAAVHLVAAWAWALAISDRVPDGVAPVGMVAALGLLAVAMAHRDAPASLTAMPDAERSDGPTRVAMLGTAVVVPVTMLAVFPATSGLDLAVRTTGISFLVVAIVVRLLIATHQHRSIRETLLQQVTRDDLTGLPNRTRFTTEVSDVLEATWHSQHRTSVIQLNLDRFKNINDNYGHYAANEVLTIVADRLSDVADQIGAVVARVGGDDFALVHGATTSADHAIAHAEAVRSALDSPITVGDVSVFVTASLGVALAARNRTTLAEDLMRQADIAAHQAKLNGRNRIELFDESMQSRLTRRMDVEHALHGAIGRREMRLYHQPIVDIVTGRISGFEALMRWERQDGTIVSPADFIPVAEETGIICELGAWAIRDGLASLRQWIDAGVVPPTTTMSVNVSPRQIADPEFPGIVRSTVAESGVPPQLLWLEITESMMLDEPELATRTLEEIRSMGIRIALDDFGTGFSSLSMLQKFPIQRIKIDRAFVRDLGEDGNDRSLVRTIIAMARSMSFDLVAEGVETMTQLESLRDLGCDKAQGFLISRPVPTDAMRSTMLALDELASLSIFETPPIVAEVPIAEPTPVRRSPQLAMAVPMGPMSTRPLGAPRP